MIYDLSPNYANLLSIYLNQLVFLEWHNFKDVLVCYQCLHPRPVKCYFLWLGRRKPKHIVLQHTVKGNGLRECEWGMNLINTWQLKAGCLGLSQQHTGVADAVADLVLHSFNVWSPLYLKAVQQCSVNIKHSQKWLTSGRVNNQI